MLLKIVSVIACVGGVYGYVSQVKSLIHKSQQVVVNDAIMVAGWWRLPAERCRNTTSRKCYKALWWCGWNCMDENDKERLELLLILWYTLRRHYHVWLFVE